MCGGCHHFFKFAKSFLLIFWNLFEKFLQKKDIIFSISFQTRSKALAFKVSHFVSEHAGLFAPLPSYINGAAAVQDTFTVFVIGTVVGFAVNLDGLTSTAVLALFMAPWHFLNLFEKFAKDRFQILFPEASAGCFFRTFCTVTHDVDFPSGTKHIFIVSTGCCGTF